MLVVVELLLLGGIGIIVVVRVIVTMTVVVVVMYIYSGGFGWTASFDGRRTIVSSHSRRTRSCLSSR